MNDDLNEETGCLLMALAPIAALIGAHVCDTDLGGGIFILVLALMMFLAYPLQSLGRYLEETAPQRAIARQRRAERRAARKRERKQREADRRARQAEAARQREEENRRKREERLTASARREAECFYSEHEELLSELCPPALFRANLQTMIPAGATPEEAWHGARDLIAGLHPIIEEATRRRKAEEERRAAHAKRVRDTERQIKRCDREIAQLSQSPVDDSTIARDEIFALRRQIQELEDEKETLNSTGETA